VYENKLELTFTITGLGMKTILQGYLQFKNERSFEKAMAAFQNRTLVYYKNEFHFRTPEFFDIENQRFIVPRSVVELSDKFWRNTTDAVDFLGQFAIYGRVEAYRIDNGKIIRKNITEPKNDKQISMDYHSAVALIESGNYDKKEVETLLSSVLKAEPDHAQALEYKAWLLIRERDLEGALPLLQQACKTTLGSSRAYYLRGILHYRLNEFEKALADFDHAIKFSLAIQDIHWKSRLQKAKTLIEIDVIETAEKELNFYLDRKFDSGSENEAARKAALFYMGQVQYLKKEFKISLAFIEKALLMTGDDKHVSDAKCIYYRGVVRRELGLDSYNEDFIRAKELGFELSAVR
jgi:tetratricopeptide (TPR) repeat protein